MKGIRLWITRRCECFENITVWTLPVYYRILSQTANGMYVFTLHSLRFILMPNNQMVDQNTNISWYILRLISSPVLIFQWKRLFARHGANCRFVLYSIRVMMGRIVCFFFSNFHAMIRRFVSVGASWDIFCSVIRPMMARILFPPILRLDHNLSSEWASGNWRMAQIELMMRSIYN